MTTTDAPTFTFDQRWRSGREARVSARTPFDPRDHRVDVIGRDRARPFVEEHHYSGSFPSCVLPIGLFCGLDLVGVAVFGVPVNEATIPRYTGLGPREGLELNRFVLLDAVGFNAESWFIARAFRLLSAEKPAIRAVVSYADPVERRTRAGEIVAPGHIGTIYQATNAVFCGRSAARTKFLWEDGRVLDERSLSKIRLRERGWERAAARLVEVGAPARSFAEEPEDWLARVLARTRRLRHPGCLAYAFGLDREARAGVVARNAGLPYPKSEVLRAA